MTLLLICESRSVTRFETTGEFFCPGFRATREYRSKRVSRYFHLYFLPLIPIFAGGEYVEYDNCKLRFDPAVLDLDPMAAQASHDARLDTAVLLVHLMIAEGVAEQAEVDVIRRVFESVAALPLEDRELAQAIERAGRPGSTNQRVLSGARSPPGPAGEGARPARRVPRRAPGQGLRGPRRRCPGRSRSRSRLVSERPDPTVRRLIPSRASRMLVLLVDGSPVVARSNPPSFIGPPISQSITSPWFERVRRV